MRKVLSTLVLIAGIYCTGYAQSSLEILDSASINRVQWRDSIFKIDKSQVPTGLLWEYSLFGFDSTKYNGVNGDDDTLKEEGRIFQLHNILWHSKINSNSIIGDTDTLLGRAFLANYNNG